MSGAPSEGRALPAPPSLGEVGAEDDVAVNKQKPAIMSCIPAHETEYVLSFENLAIYVPEEVKSKCNCGKNPFANFLQEYMGLSIEEKAPFFALGEVSGCLKSGELCLVLGSEDQSKSTLLRALSGRLNKMDEQSGSILLNGVPLPQSNQGWRRLCPYVSASDDSHSAVLTVQETFEFAAKCTSAPGETPDELQQRIQELMKVLGLDNVANIVIGDENLRGISGGQKRRVTVGEMMLDRTSRFMCCENITDGLSSSDSLHLIKNLSDGCHHAGFAGFISLLQPSDEMVELFDKVLVLTSTGELAYFGAADRQQLSSVFMEDDHGAVSGSVADMVLQQSIGPNAAQAEEALVGRYKSSILATNVLAEIAAERARAPPARKRNIDDIIPAQNVFARDTWDQFKIIASRRIKLINRNAVTWTRILIAILFGTIIGSLFSALGNNVLGALGRTGYMFLNCFLVLMLSAAITIPSSFRERATLFKHRSAEFYDGRVAYVAQVLTDAPLSILEAVLLASISYFWVGMTPTANDFLYFMGTLIGLEFVGQALGRLLCAAYRKQVTANAMSSVIILIFGTVGGFMPGYGALHPVVKWLSWVTPVSYAFEGLMITQFYDTEMESLAVTSAEGLQQAAFTGNAWLANYNIPRISDANPNGVRVFNILMLFVFAIIYDMFGFVFIERTRGWFHNQTRRPQSMVKNSFTMTANIISKPPIEDRTDTKDDGNASNPEGWPKSLACRDLQYAVPLNSSKSRTFKPWAIIRAAIIHMAGKKGAKPVELSSSIKKENELVLLRRVNARFSQRRMTALMGTSGAGKTTLMDVIAGYKTGGTVTGEVLIDGRLKDAAVWRRISGYAEQNDILNPYLSVIETLRFAANCRLASTINKQSVISRIIKLMDLTSWGNYIVGREKEGEGLPKHARKRLTIAIQLIAQPKILFLDEPTTGLGNTSAQLVINAMRAATDALGLITIATIHQPSKLIWDMFDDALILSRGGRVAFMGPVGNNSTTILQHFQGMSDNKSPKQCNPADFCLDVLNKVEASQAEAKFQQSDLFQSTSTEIDNDKASESGVPSVDLRKPNGFPREFALLTVRHMIVQWRNPSYCLMRMITSCIMSFYIGLLFVGDKSTIDGAVSTIGAIFFLVFVLVIPMQAAVVPLIEDRAVLYRETVSGTYSRISYGLGQLVADQPFHLLNTGLMFVFFYFMVDFGLEVEEVGYFLAMLYLANWAIQSLGQLFALATPNEESANGLGGLSIILSVILLGFLLPVSGFPDGWVWANWTNLLRYVLQGLVTNELAGNSYTLDLSINLPGLLPPNATSILASNIDPTSTRAHQLSSIMALTVMAGEGINPDQQSLPMLLECSIENGCFADEEVGLADAFRVCYVFNGISRPPCRDEFNSAIDQIDFAVIFECFAPDQPGGNSTLPNMTMDELGILNAFAEEEYDDVDSDSQLERVLCLMKALLPPNKIQAIEEMIAAIQRAVGVIMFVLEIIGDGISLPGELILYFFGWAEYVDGEGLVAPYKYWYCLSAVAIFLGGIEMLKLFAIQFIVWTKR